MEMREMTPELMSEAYQKLHTIFEAEVQQLSIFPDAVTTVTALGMLLLEVNSVGLLSREFRDSIVSSYNSNEDIRHIMDSTSVSFKLWLETEKAVWYRSFSQQLLDGLSLSVAEVTGIDAVTKIPQQHRLCDSDNRYSGFELTSPLDFWLICIMAIRATSGYSNFFKMLIAARKNTQRQRRPKDVPHQIDVTSASDKNARQS